MKLYTKGWVEGYAEDDIKKELGLKGYEQFWLWQKQHGHPVKLIDGLYVVYKSDWEAFLDSTNENKPED